MRKKNAFWLQQSIESFTWPISFPVPFPWLGPAPSQGKGPGNEVVTWRHVRRPCWCPPSPLLCEMSSFLMQKLYIAANTSMAVMKTRDVIIFFVCFSGRVESSHRIARSIKQEIQDLDVPVGRAEGIAVDWLSGNIYWTDAKKRVIEVASKDGYYRYALFSGLLNMPHALALDPPTG